MFPVMLLLPQLGKPLTIRLSRSTSAASRVRKAGTGFTFLTCEAAEVERDSPVTTKAQVLLVLSFDYISGIGVVRKIKVDFGTTGFVSSQHSERRCVDVDGDQVLFTNVRIAQLVNIRYCSACDFSRSAFARRSVAQPFLRIEGKVSFPEDAVVNLYCSM